MASHWTYSSALDPENLYQGDLLERTREVDSLIREYFPYHAHERNQMFMLVTQSCDLEQGKASLLSLSPVRHIKVFMREEAMSSLGARRVVNGRLLSEKDGDRLRDQLSRLVNNNLAGYFFLRNDNSQGLVFDGVALLRQKMAFKARHAEVLLAAKRGQLSTEFQAKLGWLIGDLYSRVGTQDWSSSASRKKAMQDLVDGFMRPLERVNGRVMAKVRKRLERFIGPVNDQVLRLWRKEFESEVKTRAQLLEEAIREQWPMNGRGGDCDAFLAKLKRARKFADALRES